MVCYELSFHLAAVLCMKVHMLLNVNVEQDWQTMLLQSKTGEQLQQLQPVHAASPSADVDGVSPITAFALLLIASVSCTATEASSCTGQFVIVNNIRQPVCFLSCLIQTHLCLAMLYWCHLQRADNKET